MFSDIIKGQEYKTMYRNQEFAPDYDPDHEAVRKGLGSCGAQF